MKNTRKSKQATNNKSTQETKNSEETIQTESSSTQKINKSKTSQQQDINTLRETVETKFIKEKYLSITRAPTFNNFASKLTGEIAVRSVNLGSSNAYKLMLTWIKYYNTAVRLYRIPGTPLQKHLNTTTITFKSIFSLTSALIPCKTDLIVDGMNTSSKYALLSGKLLRKAAQVDVAFSEEEEEEETTVDIDQHDTENVEEEQSTSDNDDIKEDVTYFRENKDTYNENSFVEEEINVENDKVRDELVRSLASQILDSKFIPVEYQTNDKNNVVQVLYEEAASTTQNNSPTKDDVEFFKLAISHCINMLSPVTRQRLASVLPEDQLKSIYKACSDHKNEFKNVTISNNSCIDKLFDELKQFQYDASDFKIRAYIDNEKCKETNKKSDRYMLLKIVERSIDNFQKFEKKKISESSFCHIFEDIIEVILLDKNINIDDGEFISQSSQRMAIINEYDNTEFGRRIDLLVHINEYCQDVELCGIEFKTQTATDIVLKYQQSKNIRINATILNDVIGITKNKTLTSIYMDWWGTNGYMVELFKQNNYLVAHHLTSLNIPSSLLELDDFRSTLKTLYKWATVLIKSSQEIRLSLLKNKRKYETVAISSSTSPTVSPDHSPSLLPVDIFFTPSNKRLKSLF